MKSRFVVLLLSLLSHTGFAQEVSKLSGQSVKDDLDYLYQSIQSTHYNLFAFRNQKQYDSLYHQLKTRIHTDSLTLLQTVSLYQQLVSFANTGHCEIDFPARSYIAYAHSGGVVFPLELAFENGKAFVRNNLSSNTTIEVGDEIVTIDNITIQDLLRQLYPLVSAERTYFKNAKIELLSFPRLLFQHNGRKDNWTLQIRNKANQISNTEVKAVSVIDYETSRNGEVVNPLKKLQLYGDIAYLNPGPFGSNEADGESVFKQYIDSAFSVIRTKNSKHLIIDLRNNPGGDNAYSDYLISCFAHKPFKWYSAFSVKTSKILKHHTRLHADTSNDYASALLRNTDGTVFKYDFPACKPLENAKRFKGKVYVLINRQTYSMAAVSAALIQDYKFGKIVGEETGDVPTLYASQFSYALPQTGIVVKVPKSYIVRVNGSKQLEGVKPDIYIQDHLLDANDEILATLLKMLSSVPGSKTKK